MSLHQFTITALTIMTLTMESAGLAQVPVLPQPDRNGDYAKNEALIQAKKPFNSPGSLWQVVSARLNCRRSAGMNYGIVRQFKRGYLLQANIGRGGSDEVLINATDQQGKPWMPVRSAAGENYGCYVRANSRYIQPYSEKR
jgi:hypothetical protein